MTEVFSIPKLMRSMSRLSCQLAKVFSEVTIRRCSDFSQVGMMVIKVYADRLG